MSNRKIYVKNMVCDRCKIILSEILRKIDIHPIAVHMGMVEIDKSLSPEQLKILKDNIEPLGFELIDHKKKRLIDAVKIQVMEFINDDANDVKTNISDYLNRKLQYDFGYLSNVFSSTEGMSIEQYVINQKIEKVKELLIIDGLSLTEISYRLRYSSLAHLSAQFKKVTGNTASYYKKHRDANSRISIDKVGIM